MINGFERGSTGTIIIPTTEEIELSEHDYIVEGIIEDDFDLVTLKQKYQVFEIISIDDNRKGGLQHYKIGVSE